MRGLVRPPRAMSWMAGCGTNYRRRLMQIELTEDEVLTVKRALDSFHTQVGVFMEDAMRIGIVSAIVRADEIQKQIRLIQQHLTVTAWRAPGRCGPRTTSRTEGPWTFRPASEKELSTRARR